jgi:hypothetical protein
MSSSTNRKGGRGTDARPPGPAAKLSDSTAPGSFQSTCTGAGWAAIVSDAPASRKDVNRWGVDLMMLLLGKEKLMSAHLLHG